MSVAVQIMDPQLLHGCRVAQGTELQVFQSKSLRGAPAKAEELTNPGDVKNCADFGTYREAKAYYDLYFPRFGDVAKLDGDGDGKPCEGLLKKEMRSGGRG